MRDDEHTPRSGPPRPHPPDDDAPPTYGLSPILTAAEAATFLRVNVKTVHAAIRAGELPGRKVRHRTVILRDALLDYLRSNERVLPSRRRS